MKKVLSDSVLDESYESHWGRTLNITEASNFLGAHKETVRRLVVSGKIPAVKIGKGWRFIEHDLVLYMRSQYANKVTSQGAIERREQWRYTKEKPRGGSALPITDREYKEVLGLPTK